MQQADCRLRLRLRLAEQEGELQLRSGVSNAGEGKKIPMLQGNPTRQDCHAVMGMEMVQVGKYCPKRIESQEKDFGILPCPLHDTPVELLSHEATARRLSKKHT